MVESQSRLCALITSNNQHDIDVHALSDVIVEHDEVLTVNV